MSVNKYNPTTGNLERLDGYTVDSTPTQNSGNPVSSGGVFTALEGKQDKAWTKVISNQLTNTDVSTDVSELKANYTELMGVVNVFHQGIPTRYALPLIVLTDWINSNDPVAVYGTANVEISNNTGVYGIFEVGTNISNSYVKIYFRNIADGSDFTSRFDVYAR